MSIKKSKQAEWNTRLLCLNEKIRYWCDNVSEQVITFDHLFYDNLNFFPKEVKN